MAEGLLLLDGRLGWMPGHDVPLLFNGTAESARALLAMVGGALVTVVVLVFSITFVALSQMSLQYTPRLLRTFMDDRLNQIVLGAFVGGFVYCMLVLRKVRSDEMETAFVPPLSVTATILVALGCVGLLVAFFHHVARKLQIDVVMREIHHEIDSEMDRMYPDELGPPKSESQHVLPESEGWRIELNERGFLGTIDEQALKRALEKQHGIVYLAPFVGQYLPRGATLMRLWLNGQSDAGEADAGGQLADRLRSAFEVRSERSMEQDLLFGFRQLADVALRALSPAVNDPTTAEHAIEHIGDALARLATREFPSRWRKVGDCDVYAERPDFAHYVHEALGQVCRPSANDAHVAATLLDVLEGILRCSNRPERSVALRREIADLLAELERSSLLPGDQRALRARAESVLAQVG